MTDSDNLVALSQLYDQLSALIHGDELGLAYEDWLKVKLKINPFLSVFEKIIGNIRDQPEQAGTHAYDMLAAYAQADVATTETLIHMVAATVLAKLIEDEGGGRSNISFSPLDMDAMYKAYDMQVSRDYLVTTVKLVPRDVSPESLYVQNEDVSNARPQAKPMPERPFWVVRENGRIRFTSNTRKACEGYIAASMVREDTIVAIENCMCFHPECPSSRCNHPEVTSS